MASKSWQFDATTLDLKAGLTFLVVRRTSKLVGRRVEVDTALGNRIRATCGECVKQVEGRTARQFEPDLTLDPADQYLAVPLGSTLRTVMQGDDATAEVDSELIDTVRRGPELTTIAATDIPKTGYQLYAVLVGDTPETRFAFVRKANPRRSVGPGRILTALRDRLVPIEEPVFVLDDFFDLVIAPDGIAVLNQSAFDGLFRDIDAMRERYPAYIEAVTSVLPLAVDGQQRLLDRAMTDSRIAKRLRSLHESGHLATKQVTIEQVKTCATNLGLDVGQLVKDDKLVFDDDDPFTLLKLLNDDLFIGGLSSSAFEAGSKSKRQT